MSTDISQYRYYHFNIARSFFSVFSSQYLANSTVFTIDGTHNHAVESFVNMRLNASAFYNDYFSGSVDVYFVFNSLCADTEFLLKHRDTDGISVIHKTDRGNYVFIGGLINIEQQYSIVRNYEFKTYLRTLGVNEITH